ncbi:MAG TPA: amidohydrolase family protein [Planctomycetota bacterium]|jgi:L-fuconolactonase|nr:amidohydrolase family protein [Planctomycetota bacterium]
MRLDSHQHFWRYSAKQYPWMKPEWPIRRDFLPPDLAPLLKKAGLDGSIAVHARQSLPENDFLLRLADIHPQVVRGVVGWVDLRSEQVDEQLRAFAAHSRAVGVRHVVQDEPDDDFMLRPEFVRGIGRLKQFDLTYDLLIFPKQLPAAIRLVEKFPDQPFVLDHLAKPAIRDGALSPWREQLRELARFPNVSCKVSGMVTEAKWVGWRMDDFRPYLDVAVEAFGIDRLMYGSDWPVALLAGTYAQVHGLVQAYIPPQHHAAFFGETAAKFYGISAEQSQKA